MPRRQAEYNPSYIQISNRDHRQPWRGREGGGGGREGVGNDDVGKRGRTPQRFPLNYIKNVLSFGLFFPVS